MQRQALIRHIANHGERGCIAMNKVLGQEMAEHFGSNLIDNKDQCISETLVVALSSCTVRSSM